MNCDHEKCTLIAFITADLFYQRSKRSKGKLNNNCALTYLKLVQTVRLIQKYNANGYRSRWSAKAIHIVSCSIYFSFHLKTNSLY